MPKPKKEKTAAELDREIALAISQRNVHKTPALDDIDGWSALQADRKWFRVTESKGNAKGHAGTEGQLAWLGVEGDPKAWASSPYRQKVSRVGLSVPGRHGYLFLNPRHVALIHTPTTGEDRAAIEVMLHGLSNVRSGMRKKPRRRVHLDKVPTPTFSSPLYIEGNAGRAKLFYLSAEDRDGWPAVYRVQVRTPLKTGTNAKDFPTQPEAEAWARKMLRDQARRKERR